MGGVSFWGEAEVLYLVKVQNMVYFPPTMPQYVVVFYLCCCCCFWVR